MIKHILLDIDGVLADFVTGALEIHGRPYHKVTHWNFFESMGISADEFWRKIDEKGIDFWASLKAYPWLMYLVNTVEHFCPDWTLATSPSIHHSCYAGKRLWVQRQFGKYFTRCMIGSQKHLMSREGVVLIDDSDDNCRKFMEKGEGISILFPQPWNKLSYIEDPEEKINYVRSRLIDLEGEYFDE